MMEDLHDPPYAILLDRRDHVEARFQAISKRAVRKKLQPLKWRWGRVTAKVERQPNGSKLRVERIELWLLTPTPRYQGWRFLAVLQHLDGTNVVSGTSREPVPQQYWERGAICDHCRLARQRADTYVIRHADGRTMQVGSTCLRDFLGSQEAENVAAFATFVAEAQRVAEEGGSLDSGSGEARGSTHAVDRFLEYAAADVRRRGYVSAKQAEERETMPTGDVAFLSVDPVFRERHGIAPTGEDQRIAEQARLWCEDLTDVEVLAAETTYLHNIRAIVRSGGVEWRTRGYAASVVTAYARQQQRQHEQALPAAKAHLGEVGKKLVATAALERCYAFETNYGVTRMLTFRTPEGATILWKASSTDIRPEDVGNTYEITATVKQHGDYKGTPQTEVTRAKLRQVGGVTKASQHDDKQRFAEIEEAMRALAEATMKRAEQPPARPWTPEDVAVLQAVNAAGWLGDAALGLKRGSVVDATKALRQVRASAPEVVAPVSEAIEILRRAKGQIDPLVVPQSLPPHYSEVSQHIEAALKLIEQGLQQRGLDKRAKQQIGLMASARLAALRALADYQARDFYAAREQLSAIGRPLRMDYMPYDPMIEIDQLIDQAGVTMRADEPAAVPARRN